MKGIDSYNYSVEYDYCGQKFRAASLESVQVSRDDIPNKNIQTDVTVCFRKERPQVVTIYDIKSNSFLGGIMFLAGIILIVVAFVI